MAVTSQGSAAPDDLPLMQRDWAYFLDFDGTLVDIAESPSAVRVAAPSLGLISQLSTFASGAVAIISGRPIAELDRLIGPLVLPIAGQHGVERRRADGSVELHSVLRDELSLARASIAAAIAPVRGLVLEDKGASLALHYRDNPAMARFARDIMRSAQDLIGAAYAVLEGKCVVELKLASVHKGDAVAAFLGEAPFVGRVPVFVGDDITDEHAFDVVERAGGITVKVGPGFTRAQYRVVDPNALADWLRIGMEGAGPRARRGTP